MAVTLRKSSAMQMKEANVLLDSLLANTHESLKWSWHIVMGFSVVAAANECFLLIVNLLRYFRVTGPSEAIPANFSLFDSLFSLSLFLLVFVPAFVRFVLGDDRYLDLHYLHLTQLAEDKSDEFYLAELKQFSGLRRMIDVLLLLTHGVLFIFLAKALAKPETFFLFYALLMMMNTIWLFGKVSAGLAGEGKEANTTKSMVGILEERLIRYPKRDSAPRHWIRNNLRTFVVFAFLFLAYQYIPFVSREVFLFLSLGTCIVNSIVDFLGAWYYYFPDFCDIYEGGMAQQAQSKPPLEGEVAKP